VHTDAIRNVYYKCSETELARSKSINSDRVEHADKRREGESRTEE
jgi:hypothetical protein